MHMILRHRDRVFSNMLIFWLDDRHPSSMPNTTLQQSSHVSIYRVLSLISDQTNGMTRQVFIVGLALHWRHNDHDGASNHQPHGCLLNRLFGRWSKKTSKLRVTGLCAGNSPGPVNSPHKGPVTRKCFHLMTSSWRGNERKESTSNPTLHTSTYKWKQVCVQIYSR